MAGEIEWDDELTPATKIEDDDEMLVVSPTHSPRSCKVPMDAMVNRMMLGIGVIDGGSA